MRSSTYYVGCYANFALAMNCLIITLEDGHNSCLACLSFEKSFHKELNDKACFLKLPLLPTLKNLCDKALSRVSLFMLTRVTTISKSLMSVNSEPK
jgi:hypothetical protein